MIKNKKIILVLLSLLIALIVSVFAQGYLLKNKMKLNNTETEPQALVSEEQADVGKNAKISSSIITQRKTGTGPFDADDTPGNDSSEDNNVVRSFDQITWTIENTMILKENSKQEHYSGGTIVIKAEVPEACSNFVRWDLDSMKWAENATVSSDGRTFTGTYSMTTKEITIPGKQTLVLVLKILGAPNELEITPNIEVSLYGNDDADKVSYTDETTIVSATSKYDVYLYNYNTGISVERNGESKKIYQYGVAFRILGDNSSKGIKGVEIPTGDLNFDIAYSMNREDLSSGENTDISNNISLYNYKYNAMNSSCLGDSNNTIDDLPTTTYFSKGTFPYSSSSDKRRSVYKNGNLTMIDDGNGKIHVTISNYATSETFPDRSDWGSYANNGQYSFAKNIGFISVGIFFMQVNMNDETCKANTQSYIELEAKNAKVQTVGNTTEQEESYLNNNKITANHIIYGPGSYSKETHFYSANGGYLANPWGAGNANTYIGSKVYAHNRLIIDANNDKKDWIYGVDALLKFDDTAFEPVLESNGSEYVTMGEYGSCDMRFNILYAGKKDKTGWASDSEMIATSIEDLVYFDTLDELKNAGYTCVATMIESTSGVIKSGVNADVRIPLKIKSTAKINEVAQAVLDTRYYNEGNAPDRTTQTHTKTTTKSDYPTVKVSFEHFKYVKTAYDDNGQIISGTHGGGYIYGNSLLILGADQSVSIKTVDDSGRTKVNYDVGKNETETIISIAPAITLKTVMEEKITNISIKIESKLPQGLKYVPGSSNYDEPKVVENSDGTTTLTWEIYNCTAGELINPITYKAHINEETQNGKQYTVSAIISEIIADGETGKLGNKPLEYRTSTNTIQIINLSSYSLYKTTETPIIEINGLIHYKVTAINKTDDPITDFQLLDILPYNGDNRGTNFNGTVTAKKIDITQINSLTSETIDNSNLNIYITNQESVRTGVTAKDEDLGKTTIWNTVAPGASINSDVTAYAVIGKIAARTRLEIDIYLQTNGNKPSDTYKNSASAQINKETEAMETPVITVQDVKRSLSGKVWFDENKDGIINDGEELLSNVTVTLINEDGTPAIDNSGDVIPATKTDSNGDYYFEDMVKANYKIKVEVTDSEKEITIKNAGTNQEINSKFNKDQMTDVITELNSVASPVISKNFLNAGIAYKDTSVIVHHYIKGTTTKLSADVTIKGKITDTYNTTVAKDIPEYYELVAEPTNKTGKMTKDTIEVIYYYQLKKYPYTVNYLEKDTNKVLKDSKKVADITYGTAIKSQSEVIDINGYKYDSVDKDTLTIGTSENVINIYYTKRTDLSYKVNYLEKDTNKVLHTQKVQDGMTFENTVKSSDEVIKIDGYNYNSVDKETLTITTGENVINIYYTKRTDLSYTVNYLEKDTNKVLHDPKATGNMTFGATVTSSKEVISINGYDYNSVDKETLTITTGENVINIYYTKRNNLSYIVNYLEKDTNKVLHNPKTTGNMTFGATVTSSKEVISIDGYNYNSVDKETLTITTGENIINIYYTKRNNLSYTVNYLEKGTNKKLINSKQVNNVVFETVIKTADEKEKIYGYDYDSADKDQLIIGTGENVINLYYIKKSTKVIVHYYEEGTTKKLSEDVTINGKVNDAYETISAKDILPKYELVAEPENKTGVMTEDTIEVIYYYRVKDAVVNARYLEKGTEKQLATPETKNGKVDEDYETTAKNIEGYQLVEVDGNQTGKYTIEPITVTYYYLYKTKATVQYIDKITGQILEQSTTEGLEGDDFVTESKDFENYILVEEPAEKTVKMTKEEQILKYYYIHISGGVIEKHIDIISGKILANEEHKGKEGDDYDIPSRTFEGYDLVEEKLPTNSQGKMTIEPIEVIYYYIYKTKVTAEYIDKITGEKLTEDVITQGHEADDYQTERKKFDDYKLIEVPKNADGKMTKEDITVTYYYVHISGGVIVNHIDIKTNKQLKDESKIEGYEGDYYETHEEDFEGYDLVKEKYPDNANGKMTIDVIRVTYYYIRKSEVNVKYIDKETGEEIEETTNIKGHEDDEYNTEPKDIPGYDLIEEPANKNGTMTVDPIEVIYYYKRPANVIVNYYDIDTKEKIADEIQINGHQNDEYTTEEKDIKYYKIEEIPENKDGKMIVTVTKDENGDDIVEDTTYVNYYYRKLTFNLKIEKIVDSIIVDGAENKVDGNLGKIEINRKKISTSNIRVKYKIKVSNDSELSGKAQIIENIPSGMKMKLEDNYGWNIQETIAIMNTKEIKPGESVEYTVTLEWINGENAIGTKENTVQLGSIKNEANFEEKDTTDNEDKADVIISIGTGEKNYKQTAIGLLFLVIEFTAVIYVFKKIIKA